MNMYGSLFSFLQSWPEPGKGSPPVEAFSVPAVLSAASRSPGKGMQEALNELLAFSRQLSVASTLEDLSAEIAQGAVDILQATYSRVMVLQPDHTMTCAASFDRRLGGTSAVKQTSPPALQLYQRAALNAAPLFFRRGSPSLSSAERHLLGLTNRGGLCLAPMRLNTEAIGLLVLGQENDSQEPAHLEEKSRLISFLAEQSAAAIYRVSLSGRLRENQLETVLALAKALEARDPHTAGHGQRMTELAEKIASKMGMAPTGLETIRWAALLHDIGKIGIADEILRKEGPLTSEEWFIMKKHPLVGAEIVMNVSNLADVAGLIHSHHERFDGKGYPRGLVGEEIPLGARIIAVVDTYSAMTDGRVYRPRCTHAEATAELIRCSGKNYDPMIVEAFLSNYP